MDNIVVKIVVVALQRRTESEDCVGYVCVLGAPGGEKYTIPRHAAGRVKISSRYFCLIEHHNQRFLEYLTQRFEFDDKIRSSFTNNNVN